MKAHRRWGTALKENAATSFFPPRAAARGRFRFLSVPRSPVTKPRGESGAHRWHGHSLRKVCRSAPPPEPARHTPPPP